MSARGDRYAGRSWDLTDLKGAGSIVSTIGDMIKLNAALSGGSFLNPSSKAELWKQIGLTGGDLSYGETTLDQMFMNRPFPGHGGASTPLRNFYLCSPSAHPGPLVMGGSGANAAAEVIAARGGRR